MAKVYETKEHLRRDELGQQLSEAHKHIDNGNFNILSGTGLGLMLGIGQTRDTSKLTAKRIKFENVFEKILIVTSAVSVILGVYEYVTGKRQHRTAEKELRDLGPEQIRMPCNVDFLKGSSVSHVSSGYSHIQHLEEKRALAQADTAKSL